jgi:hypothetical protein
MVPPGRRCNVAIYWYLSGATNVLSSYMPTLSGILRPVEAKKRSIQELCIHDLYFSSGAVQGLVTRVSRFSPSALKLQVATDVPGDFGSTVFGSLVEKQDFVFRP